MKNYRKSDYALNKFSEGIVYQFSDRTLEISLEDFMRDNPGKTEADFMALKAVSDEIYLEQARLETAQGNKTFSMTGLEDAISVLMMSEVLICTVRTFCALTWNCGEGCNIRTRTSTRSFTTSSATNSIVRITQSIKTTEQYTLSGISKTCMMIVWKRTILSEA